MNARVSMRVVAIFACAALVTIVAVACGATYDEAASSSDGGGDALAEDGNAPADGGGGDAGDGDGALGDARCSPSRPFGMPTTFAELNTADDDNRPNLSPDELRIYFERDDFDGGVLIMVASRMSRTDPFGPAQIAPGLAARQPKGDPSVSADELTIFMSYYTAIGRDVHTSTRNSKTSDFGLPQPVPGLATMDEETHPFLTYDGTELWFASNRPPTLGGRDLWVARRGINGIEPATHVAELSSPEEDGRPVLNPDGLEIFFGSTRAGSQGRDIWTARRATKNDPWGPIENVLSINTPYEETPGWVSLDGCRLYFASNRGAGDPDAKRDLWVASRAP